MSTTIWMREADRRPMITADIWMIQHCSIHKRISGKPKMLKRNTIASRGMEYNSKKTKVFSIKEGFTFLGFKYRLTDTGKVIMTVSSEKVKERRRKLRKLVRKAKRGRITKAKVDDCYQAWRSPCEQRKFLSPYTPHGQILQEFME